MVTRARVYEFLGGIRTPAVARVYEFRADTDTTPRPKARVYEFVATTVPAPRRRLYEFLAMTSVVLQGNAGSDQTVDALQRVFLSGLASGGVVTHWHWEQTAGPLVTLYPSPDVAQPSFDAPATEAGTMIAFELTVSDDDGNSDTSPDSVQIVVRPHIEWQCLGGDWQPYLEILLDDAPDAA